MGLRLQNSLKPLVMMCARPFWVVFYPPIPSVPMMVLVPIAVLRPLRVMCFHPVWMIVQPPIAGVPGMLLIVITHARGMCHSRNS